MKPALGSLMTFREDDKDYEPLDIDLDPLFVALICKLPAQGSKWTRADRDQWLRMFYAIADGLHPESIVNAAPVERAQTTTVEHQRTEITKVTHEAKSAAIPSFVNRIEPGEETDTATGLSSTRLAILRVLWATDCMLSAKEIVETDDTLDQTQCNSQLSHMTLRNGWLKREKRGEVYVYQVNEKAQIPAHV